MLPIIFDGSMVRVGLVARGEGLARRLKVLHAGGVTDPVIFTDRLPSGADLAGLQLLFVAGRDELESRQVAEAARRAGVLVNVEDVPALCDFHVPAQVRRGDLSFIISTCGRSPGLSRILREELEVRFGPEWGDHLDEIAQLRAQWRAEGLSPDVVSERTRAFVAAQGWLR